MSLTSVHGHLLAAKTPMQSYFIARFQEGCTLRASHSDLWNYQTKDILRFTKTSKHWKTPLLWILDYFGPIQRLGGQNFQTGLLLHSGPIYSFLFARAKAQENAFLLKRNKTSLYLMFSNCHCFCFLISFSKVTNSHMRNQKLWTGFMADKLVEFALTGK